MVQSPSRRLVVEKTLLEKLTETLGLSKKYVDEETTKDRARLKTIEAALPYRGLWAGGGDMDEWRADMRGTWEVRDATGYARPANFPPNVPASVTALVSVDTSAGGHTVQTVKPTGNGQALWFRVSKNYTGAGPANWSDWRRADSTLRPRLADGTNIDTLRLQAHEGTVSITATQAKTLTGLPEDGAFGSLTVQPSYDGLASQFMHQLTAGGGETRLWWRMVNHATVFSWGRWQLLTPAPAEDQEPDVRVPFILTTGGGPTSTTTQTAVHARLPINLPARAREWRAHFRNYNYRDAQAYAGSLSLQGVAIGAAELDAGHRPTGQWSGTPEMVMPAGATPANAAVFTTPWITSPLDAGRDYLLGYAYTGAAGQVSYLGVGGGWLGTNPAGLLTDDRTLTQQKYMPLDVWLEIKTDAGTEVIAYLGDSLTAGVSADLPVYDSYPLRHARANGHMPIIYADSGSALPLWTNPNSGHFTRWAGMTKPSRLYWSIGSNDIFQPVDIPTMRARFAAALPAVTAATSKNIILTTILPRLAADAPAEAVRKEWNRVLEDELPGNALMCIDAAAGLTDADGTLSPRWRAAPTDIHLNKQGYARFAAAL